MNTGTISVKNALEMVKNLGIKINFDEARVLVASVDMDKSGDLSLNEFMDLIFNSTDVLNVDLKKMPGTFILLSSLTFLSLTEIS
jgi:hypothetical protein